MDAESARHLANLPAKHHVLSQINNVRIRNYITSNGVIGKSHTLLYFKGEKNYCLFTFKTLRVMFEFIDSRWVK